MFTTAPDPASPHAEPFREASDTGHGSGVSVDGPADLVTFDEGARRLLVALKRPPVAMLALLVFFVPLTRVSVLEDSFNTPKIALLLGGLLVLGIHRLGAAFRPRAVEDVPNLPQGDYFSALCLWGLLGVWHLVSVAWADSAALAVMGLIHLLTGLAVLVFTAVTLRKAEEAGAILGVGVLSAVVTAGWTVMEDVLAQKGITALVARLPDWRGYLSAGLGNSGHIAGWCGLFLFPLLVGHCLVRRPSTVTWLGILLVFLTLVVTWSVGSTGATLLALGVWTVVGWRSGGLAGLTALRMAGVVGLGLAAMAFYFTPHPLNPHRPSLWTEAFGSQRWKDGLPTRQVIYETTLEMIRQRPLLGWGVGNFTLQYVQQKPESVHADRALLPYAGAYTNDAHNDLLQVTAETGMVGAVLAGMAFLVWMMATVRGVFRRDCRPGDRLVLLSCGCGVTVFLLDGLMSFPSRLPAHWMAMMLFQGMAMGITRPVVDGESVGRPGKPNGWFVPAVLVTLLLISLPWMLRRLVAEFSLKAARTEAELVVVWSPEGPASAWTAIQGQLNLAVEAIGGQRADVLDGALRAASEAVGRPEMARPLALLARAERFDPRYTNATSRRSVALMAQGRWEEAAKLLERIMLDLQSPEILERLALCRYMTGKGSEAAALWIELSRRQPQLGARYSALAEAALRPPLRRLPTMPVSGPAGP